MAQAAMSQLPASCREWLFFEVCSSNELGVEFLDMALGFYTEEVTLAITHLTEPRSRLEASIMPLLVPEFDSADFALGHCYYLNVVDIRGASQIFAGCNNAKLSAARERVEQRFVLFKGANSRMRLNLSSLYDDGCVFISSIQMGTERSLGHTRSLSWMCLSGNPMEPDLMFSVDSTKMCALHDAEFSVGVVNGPDATRVHPVCNCSRCYGPNESSSDMAERTAWQCYKRFVGSFRENSTLLIKTVKFIPLRRRRQIYRGAAEKRIDVASPTMELRSIARMICLEGRRLQRIKVEYVQLRLESMLNYRGDLEDLGAASARRFKSMLRVTNSAMADVLQRVECDDGRSDARSTEIAAPSPSTSKDVNDGTAGISSGDVAQSPNEASVAGTSGSDDEDSPFQSSTCRVACTLCAATFSRKYELERHVKCVHLKVKRYACEQCDRSFFQWSHLRTHAREVHEGVRDSLCKLCSRRFVSDAKLNRHVRTVHLRERPHKCSMCEVGFAQRSDLYRHKRSQHSDAYTT